MEKSLTFRTYSGQETITLGARLGAFLEAGDVVALTGDLGSGKTWLTKGVALGLDVPKDSVITSPSFALMNEYRGRCALFHMDVYRLEDLSDFLDTGLEEYFYAGGVVVMEWADRWPEILPERSVWARLRIVDENSREIALYGSHQRALKVLEQLEMEVEQEKNGANSSEIRGQFGRQHREDQGRCPKGR